MRMRTEIFAACCLLFLGASASAKVAVAAETQAPALTNPSFEDQGVAPDRAAGWSRWGNWFNREDGWTPVRSGRCILGYHHWEIPSSNDSGVYQDCAGAIMGRLYTFGIYVNPDKAKGDKKEARTIELRLESTLNGQQLTLASKSYKLADLAPDRWERLFVSGAPVNNTLRVLVIVTPAPNNGSRGGALRFDDAFIERAD